MRTQHHKVILHRVDASAILKRDAFIIQCHVMFTCFLNQTYRLIICLFLVTSLLAAEVGVRSVSAQPSDSVEIDTTTRVDSTAPADSPKRKSPRQAVLYSLGGTVLPTLYSLGGAPLPALVFGAGLVFGPSFGHVYAKNYRQAVLGIGVRLGGGALLVDGIEILGESERGKVIFGALLLVGSAVRDILTAGNAAKSHNESLSSNVRVAPTANPHSGQVGLSLQVQL